MDRLTRRRLGATLGAVALPLPALAAPTRAALFKDPSCGCCEGHAEYLRREGFAVEVRPTDDLERMSSEAGVPAALRGCHLIQVGGYVVEGHMSAPMPQAAARASEPRGHHPARHVRPPTETALGVGHQQDRRGAVHLRRVLKGASGSWD